MQEVMDALRLDRTDAGNAVDGVDIGCNKILEGVKSVGQKSRGSLADIWDAERKDKTLQWTLLAGFDSRSQVVDAGFTEALELSDRLPVQRIDVSEIANHAEIHEPIGELFTEALNVHAAARGEVMNMTLELSGAGGIGAVTNRFAFSTVSGRPANRAAHRHDEFPLTSISPLDNHLNNLGNNVSSALHDDSVAD